MPKNTLADVEARHGFTFGVPDDHDSQGAPVAGALACSNPKCKARGILVQIHEDTVRPVHCSACHTVLLAGETPQDDVSHVVLDAVPPEVLDQLLAQLEARKARR